MSDERQRAFSRAPWEAKVGYCRGIRVRDQIFVTGTAPVGDDGEPHAPGDAYAQALRCFEIIGRTLEELGSNIGDVVRTRMFVTNIDLWEEFGRAHHAVFANHPPTTTMVEVSRLIDPAFLIEIEADAVAAPSAGKLSGD